MGAQVPGLLGRETELTKVIRPFERGVELARRANGAAALTKILTELVTEGRMPSVAVETTGRKALGVEAMFPNNRIEDTNIWRTTFDDTKRRDLIKLLEKSSGEQEQAIRDLVRGFVSANPKLNGPKALQALQTAFETAVRSVKDKLSLVNLERESFDQAARKVEQEIEKKVQQRLGITPEILAWKEERDFTLMGREAFARHDQKSREMNALVRKKGFASFDAFMKEYHKLVGDGLRTNTDYIKFSSAAERLRTIFIQYQSVSEQLSRGIDALKSVKKPVFEGAENLLRQLKGSVAEELHGRKPIAVMLGAVAAAAVAAAAYYMLKPEEEKQVPKKIERPKKMDF